MAKKGQFDNALKCYAHALEIDPNFVHAFVARGAAYLLMQQIDKAAAEFEVR